MTNDPHPWAANLTSLQTQVWSMLVRGVGDRHASARHLTLATVSPEGWPEARTIMLRAAHPEAATLDIHTDLRSAKVSSLQHNSRAALHVWDASTHLQIRIEATVSVLTDADIAPIWARVPDLSRQNYATSPAPGQPIASGLAYETGSQPTSFAVLRCYMQAFDVLQLGPRHRRARFERATGWNGQWLVP